MVEYLGEYLRVVGIAEGVLHYAEVGVGRVVPAALIEFSDATAAFTEACIAHLSLVAEHDASGGADGFEYLRCHLAAHSLVALAVVVGTYVEMGMGFAVVPLYQLRIES